MGRAFQQNRRAVRTDLFDRPGVRGCAGGASRLAQHVPNDDNRQICLVGQPFTLSRTPSRMVARPPEFGEQTEEVLAEFGFSADEIAELRKRKVV